MKNKSPADISENLTSLPGELRMLRKAVLQTELTSAWYGLTLKSIPHQDAAGPATHGHQTATISINLSQQLNHTEKQLESTPVNTNGNQPWDPWELAPVLLVYLYGMLTTTTGLHSEITSRSEDGTHQP